MLIKYENLTIRNAVTDDAEQLCAWWNDGKIEPLEYVHIPCDDLGGKGIG